VALKEYYQLLEIAPTASADEVKRAFRVQIARYHPDKVQHLGKEFQAMAADRAAELTEAYRILSDDGRRAEYDRARGTSRTETAPASAAPPPPRSESAPPSVEPESGEAPPPPPPPGSEAPKGGQFKQERATRDEYVRKATVGRFRQALEAVGGGYDEQPVRGFDISFVPKSKMFGRGKGPRLMGRFVSRVDREAVADAWTQASKLAPAEEVCVFLMGTSVAPAGELAGEIADQRRKTRSSKLTLIPVDARDWEAHMPLDAPAIAKSLLTRLKSGS
jgi:curved DNA-binding protein CbpA